MKNTEIPPISVCMPCYNAEKYIERSVEAVLCQTFQDYEFIIVDDGSTDNTLSVLKQFSDPRMRIIESDHDFIKSSNLLLSEAKGKYIARIDADDMMLPDRLQIQYDFMEKNPDIDVAGSWFKYVGGDDVEAKPPTDHTTIAVGLLTSNYIAQPTVMIRKESLVKNGLSYNPDYHYAEDYRLWIDCLMKGCRFANIPEILLHYTSHKDQITNKHYDEMMNFTIEARLEYAEFVMNKLAGENEDLNTVFEGFNAMLENDTLSMAVFLNILSLLYRDYLNKQL